MRALRRIATPASVAVALSGCTYGFDDYLPRATYDGPATSQDDATYDGRDLESGVFETAIDSSVTDVAIDTAIADTTVEPDTRIGETAADTFTADTFTADTFTADTFVVDTGKADTCACVKMAGPKCKEWSPPGCGD